MIEEKINNDYLKEDFDIDADSVWFVKIADDPLIFTHKTNRGKVREEKKRLLKKIDQVKKQIKHKVPKASVISSHHKSIVALFLKPSLTKNEVELIAKLPYVEFIIFELPAFIHTLDSVPLINADDVWNTLGYTGVGVKVAVIDTGLDYNHIDFTNVNLELCSGFDSDGLPEDDITDFNGHGTHVAGTVLGNGPDYKGVAKDAELISYRVCNSAGICPTAAMLAAMERSMDIYDDDSFIPVDVVNMSLGGGGAPDTHSRAMAIDNNVNAVPTTIWAISAGNSGPYCPDTSSCRYCWMTFNGGDTEGEYQNICCPGCAEHAVTVGNSDKNDFMNPLSSVGPTWPLQDGSVLEKPDITAPGTDICAARSQDAQYWTPCSPGIDNFHSEKSGTSMAAPHVAGAIALMKQQNPDITVSEVKMRFYTYSSYISDMFYNLIIEEQYSGDPLEGGNDNWQGYGRINIYNAIMSEGGGEIYGCTHPNACNYDADATNDDGSCLLPGPGLGFLTISMGLSETVGPDGWCRGAGPYCDENNTEYAYYIYDVTPSKCCELYSVGPWGGAGDSEILDMFSPYHLNEEDCDQEVVPHAYEQHACDVGTYCGATGEHAGTWACNDDVDACGICFGPGPIYNCGCSDDIPEGDCDCEGNVLDECGICGGNNADIDECGICFGPGAIYGCGCLEYLNCWDGSEVCNWGECPPKPVPEIEGCGEMYCPYGSFLNIETCECVELVATGPGYEPPGPEVTCQEICYGYTLEENFPQGFECFQGGVGGPPNIGCNTMMAGNLITLPYWWAVCTDGNVPFLVWHDTPSDVPQVSEYNGNYLCENVQSGVGG